MATMQIFKVKVIYRKINIVSVWDALSTVLICCCGNVFVCDRYPVTVYTLQYTEHVYK
jgi:hypothetical protein